MRINRKVLLAAAMLFMAAPVWSQTYPAHPVRIIVPFSPGGATDIVTRLVAQKLTEAWGQTVVVDNRAGASGNIGADLAAKSNPDGYTIFMTLGSIVSANQHIFKRLPFDPEKDFAAVTNVAAGPQAIVVNPGSSWKTLKEYIAAMKAKPRGFTYGSAGVATQTHLAAENFLYTAGIDVVHVPYKGEAPAIVDLIGGQIDMVTANLAAAIAFVQQGKLRALAVTSKERVRSLPDVPAAAETLPGFENLGWFGFVVPAATPKPIVLKLYQDTAKVLQSGDIHTRFEQIGMVAVGSPPDAFAREIKSETLRWAKIVKGRRLQVE